MKKEKVIKKVKSLKDLRKEYQLTLLNIYSGKEKNVKKAFFLRKEIARFLTNSVKN